MSRINYLLKYHFLVYMKSNKFVMPLFIFLLFVGTTYSTTPLPVVSTLVMISTSLFYLMVWISMTYMTVENPVSEQLIILKVKSHTLYNFSKILFLLLVGIALSIISIIVTILIYLFGDIFIRNLTLIDILAAFILHCFIALLGVIVGMFFNSRVIKERKSGIMLTVLVAVMALAKVPLNEKMPLTKFITWLFPPLYNVIDLFIKDDFFLMNNVAIAVLYICIYSLIAGFLYLYILKKKKF